MITASSELQRAAEEQERNEKRLFNWWVKSGALFRRTGICPVCKGASTPFDEFGSDCNVCYGKGIK